MANKKTGFVDLEKLEAEADVMSSAGGKEFTYTPCSCGCPTNGHDFGYPYCRPTYICGPCAGLVIKVTLHCVNDR